MAVGVLGRLAFLLHDKRQIYSEPRAVISSLPYRGGNLLKSNFITVTMPNPLMRESYAT